MSRISDIGYWVFAGLLDKVSFMCNPDLRQGWSHQSYGMPLCIIPGELNMNVRATISIRRCRFSKSSYLAIRIFAILSFFL